jgi:UDP-N-acetylmuramoyl-L-alanyl-D-glutamate--2,6-diaminopimelate ligase
LIVTTDNPRSEDPAEIANDIVRGIRQTGAHRWTVVLDRAAAIHDAIAGGNRADIVLVAGKGHETYQESQGVRLPFADSIEAAAALANWNGGESK